MKKIQKVKSIKDKDRNDYISPAGFKYRFSWEKDISTIYVCLVHPSGEYTGYGFPVQEGKIVWAHPEGAEAYVGDDVRDTFIPSLSFKYCA